MAGFVYIRKFDVEKCILNKWYRGFSFKYLLTDIHMS